MYKFRCILIFGIFQLFYHLMGKLNFQGYLILKFYPTHEIPENSVHAKSMCFTV